MTDIRRAREGDVEGVVALESNVFGLAAWSWDSVQGELAYIDQTRYVVVATDGGRLVGYASLMYVAGLADLQRIAVWEAYRRTGVASAMLHELLDVAVDRGCVRIVLEVAANNEPAVGFYERHGFVPVSRRPRYYAGGVDAVVMQRILTPRH